MWSKRRFTAVLVVAALAVMVIFLVTPALGLFTVPNSAGVVKAQIYTSPTIGTPTNFDCTWSTAAANPTTVSLSWTNAQAWSTTQYERNVNGGAYTTATVPVTASTVPVTNVSTPAANQYGYRAKAVASNWISGYTSAITDENCKGAINKLIDGSVNAKLNNPHDVAVDSLGNVYIADTNNHRIRCIAASGSNRCNYPSTATAGNIYTYAGTGSSGASGDAGPKGSAQLNGPKGIWIDQYDNLLISDTGNGAIRIVRPTGGSGSSTIYNKAATNVDYMYTITGALGTSGYAGDGGSSTLNTVRFASPQDIATDSSDNLYIADTANARVRCVAATAKCGTTGNLVTYAGTGTSGYVSDGQPATNANSRITSPTGLAVNAGGSLIIGDKGNSRIRMVYWSGEAYGLGSLTQTFIYTITTSANNPWGVVVDSSDNILWGDSGGSLVKAFFASTSTRYGITTPDDNTVYTIAGNGSGAYNGTGLPPTGSGSVNIAAPYGIAIDSSTPTQVYSVDNGRGVVRKLDYANGYVFTWAGISGTSTYVADDVPAHGWEYSSLNHSSVDSTGANIYFADAGDNRIRKWIVACGCLVVAAGNGNSTSNGDSGSPLAAGLNAPQGVHIDSSGNLYIAETGAHKIRMVPASNMSRFNQVMLANNIYTILGNGSSCTAGNFPCGDSTALSSNLARLNAPRDVLTDSLGNLIVSDTTNCEIRLVANATTTRFGLGTLTVNNIYRVGGTQLSCGNGGDGSPATNAGATLNSPDGITLDGSNNLYIADSGGARIRSISSSGTLNTFAGTGSCGTADGSTASATLCGARDVSYESSTGAIYIADTGNTLVRKVLSGQMSTIAGGGSTTTGDTGPGRGAVLVNPVGVAAKPSGDIYVTQNGTNVDMRSIKGPA